MPEEFPNKRMSLRREDAPVAFENRKNHESIEAQTTPEMNRKRVETIVEKLCTEYERIITANPRAWQPEIQAMNALDATIVPLEHTVSPSEGEQIYQKLRAFAQHYQGADDAHGLQGQITFPGNLAKEPPGFSEMRKVYLAPELHQLPEFLPALMKACEAMRVPYHSWKMHFEGLERDQKETVIAQKQNLVCFYFTGVISKSATNPLADFVLL